MGRIAIFGVNSGIARAVSAEFLRRGDSLVLIGRNEAALRAEGADLLVRHGRECEILV